MVSQTLNAHNNQKHSLLVFSNHWSWLIVIRYFPTNLDFRHTLSVRPDYEILQGETKRQGEETKTTNAENRDPNL